LTFNDLEHVQHTTVYEFTFANDVMERIYVAFTLPILLNVNLRHFYTITLLIYIVRRPCCVSALTFP